ncbi:hypothetical protein HB822_11285 [Listeria innocua]|nr:hypothetical protein [Listeria innocua]
MNKTAQMNSGIFQINLEETLKEIVTTKVIQSDENRFVIVPVDEKERC